MPTPEQTARYNARLMEGLSALLDAGWRFVGPESIDELVRECGVTPEHAVSLALAAAVWLDVEGDPEDKALFRNYFPAMLRRLDAQAYAGNPYYRQVRVPPTTEGRWEFREQRYAPYEVFVRDDLEMLPDGRIVPQVGYFDCEFPYPVVLENGREWMLVTPNEIETINPAVEAAEGRVLTYGLGLGYFAFMASEKQAVSSVTVVEKDAEVIRLFERHLLPQFGQAQKIELVHDDAFAHAQGRMAAGGFDLVFTDLWHDPSDGVELYLRMKRYEGLSPGSRFFYWIEKTLRCYLPESPLAP